jgi:hypothetical protein
MRLLIAAAAVLFTTSALAQDKPAAEPKAENPIEFIIGDQVVTRAEVRRPIDQKALADPKKRRKLYETVRMKLAQDYLLYQYALHRGVSVTPAQVDRVVQRELRQHAGGGTFGRAISEMHGSLDAYKALVKRRQTIGRLEARAAYGPELTSQPPTAPERILFSRHRQRAILERCDEAAEHLAKTAPGELYVLRFSTRQLDNAEGTATEFAKLWTKGQDAAAIRAELAKRKFEESAARLKPIVLLDSGWETKVYNPQSATALYRTISALQPGQVSEPTRQGGHWYVFWLKSVPRQQKPGTERVQASIAMTLSQERAAELQSKFVRAALRTTFVWPDSLRQELNEKHAAK